jgi:cytochrome P450
VESFGSLLPSSPIDSEASINASNIAQKGVGIRILLGKLRIILARYSKFQHACELTKDYTQRHIERTVHQQAKSDKVQEQKKIILVSELVKETNDRSELCNQLLNVFFAGRDTPAVALTSIFFLLARHPDIWEKCRAEVKSLQKEDLTFKRLKSLRYIQHGINEGERSHEHLWVGR